MKKVMTRLAPFIATLALLVAFAMPASAAPSSIQPKGLQSFCQSVATVSSSPYQTSDDSQFRVQSFIQQLKSSDGSSCGEFRVRLAVQSNTGGSVLMSLRSGGLNYYPSGSAVAGSSFTDSTDYWQSPTWFYSTGPWVSLCNQTIQAGAFAFDTSGGYAFKSTNSFWTGC